MFITDVALPSSFIIRPKLMHLVKTLRARSTQLTCKRNYMATRQAFPTLVTADWLKKSLSQSAHSLSLLDCSWYLPKSHHPPIQDFEVYHLKGASFFDIDKVCDSTTTLPHMLPTAEQFAQHVSAMGINNTDHVICYDFTGQYMASARVWWMFKVFGHDAVSVLSKGLIKEEWLDSPQLTASGPAVAKKGSFVVRETRKDLVKTMPEMLNNNSTNNFQVVDARSYDRFYARVPEPRPNLQRGHMPNSKSVPFNLVLNNREIVSGDNLREILAAAGVDLGKPLTTTCGSGVTAAVVSLALSTIGKETSIYDGSWAEYGQETLANPVETN